MMLKFAPLPVSAIVAALWSAGALAAPSLVVDVDSGQVLHSQEATRSWFPASVTKLMTAYVALAAIRDGRITGDTPMVVSQRAARMAPSKMGFRPGSEITLDNALKIIMVKSANDVSVTIAEGVGGSVEGFSALMNAASARLGMLNSRWVNPNGLPDARQVTSARDMAILARALLREFPEHRDLWNIGAIQFGQRYMPNHNGLIGRYPGADGMKTGFICAGGFNVVATARRNGRHVITVVFGQPSATERTAYAAQLFDKAFAGGGGGGDLYSMGGAGVSAAPDIRGEVCVRRSRGGGWAGEVEDLSIPIGSAAQALEQDPKLLFVMSRSAAAAAPAGRSVAYAPRERATPVMVYLGRAPGWSGSAVGPGAVAAASRAAGRPATPVIQTLEPADSATALAPAAVQRPGRAPIGARAPVSASVTGAPLRLNGDLDDAAPASGAARKPAARSKPATQARPVAQAASRPVAAPAARPAQRQAGKPARRNGARPGAQD